MSGSENDRLPDPAQERRQFFRIEDSVNLGYQPVDPADLQGKLESLNSGLDDEFMVMSSLAAISQQMMGVMRRIETAQPDVADYLRALDRKVDLLGRVFLFQFSDLSEQPARAVNLSASGMAFFTSEPVDTGAILELRLLLLPSYTGLLIYADVVACDREETADGDPGYHVRVNFSRLRECDRDVLVRHILQRQSRMLQRQREEREEQETHS